MVNFVNHHAQDILNDTYMRSDVNDFILQP